MLLTKQGQIFFQIFQYDIRVGQAHLAHTLAMALIIKKDDMGPSVVNMVI